MLAGLFSLLPLALSAVAFPVARQIEPSAWCPLTLGAGIFDIAYNFTLAAYNITLPNANSTGAPLVVGYGGAIVGAEFHLLSVRGLYDSISPKNLIA